MFKTRDLWVRNCLVAVAGFFAASCGHAFTECGDACGSSSVGGTPGVATGGSGSSSGGSNSISGGSSALGGSGAQPQATSLFVDTIKVSTVDKVDLLFALDNSVSMADKQRLLKDSVPALFTRLMLPDCISSVNPSMRMSGLATCPVGYAREFSPVTDIHIGVVSSSLGGHGSMECSRIPEQNDAAHLIGVTARGKGTPTYNNLGFLAWDPTAQHAPPGEANADTLIKNFQDLVAITGESGCGFEAQLESWYRFLIEPEPYMTVSLDPATQTTVQAGLDMDLLNQRKAFLRADSLLAIIMLTDENDCSVVDEGLGWLVGTSLIEGGGVPKRFNFPRPTSICESAPNSPCCRSCASTEALPPMGCDPLGADPQCQRTPPANSLSLEAAKDPLNLRCFHQKKRFGLDLLYPTERYVLGLREPSLVIPDRTDPKGLKTKTVPNPIYTDLQGNAPFVRGPEWVFVAGIVGVPWQDIADDASLSPNTGLKYLTANELSKRNVWNDILGTPVTGLNPKDPLMIESVAPRSGINPRTGTALAPATSTNPKENPINGHEFNNADGDDLQYACIFDLPEASRDCTNTTGGCDCGSPPSGLELLATIHARVAANNSPLCNPPTGGPASTTQHAGKAYPGLRILQVLKDYGPNAVVASACPKISKALNGAEKASSSYGYNPAMHALVDRFADSFTQRCLPRALVPNKATGAVPCSVVEAYLPKPGEACSCGAGRLAGPVGAVPQSESLANVVRGRLQQEGQCADAASCQSFCLCEIEQLAGNQGCESDNPPPAGLAGFCYIDATAGIGDPALVGACPASEKRELRFVGSATPRPGATALIACSGPML